MAIDIKHAVWKYWPHVGPCYRVRTRGGPSAFSADGFDWTDSRGNPVDRPARIIQFHGGRIDGRVEGL